MISDTTKLENERIILKNQNKSMLFIIKNLENWHHVSKKNKMYAENSNKVI